MKRYLTECPPVSGRWKPGARAAVSRGELDGDGCRRGRRARAFSLIELIIAMAVISLMLLFLAEMTGSVADTWAQGESRVETFQSARASLELITREMTPAVVDTRMQFAILPGEELERAGAKNVAPGSSAALWMSPLGEQGDLRCVGYYLYRDDVKQFYRLKRLFITAENEDHFFPLKQVVGDARRSTSNYSTNPEDADWFTRNWNAAAFDEEDPANDKVVVSAAGDGVVALWMQAIDLLGNPIPWVSGSKTHPPSELMFNSAAYFQQATSVPYEDGSTTKYLAEADNVMRANRVPAAVDITVVTMDNRILARNPMVPVQEDYNVMDSDGTIDLLESVRRYNEALVENNIKNARTFSTRVKLLNGS